MDAGTVRLTVVVDRPERVMLAFDVAGPVPAAPLHLHPAMTKHYRVVDGELTIDAGGHQRRLRSCDGLTVPAGAPHAVRGAGPDGVKLVVRTEPALGWAQCARRLTDGEDPNAVLGDCGRETVVVGDGSEPASCWSLAL